VRHLVLDLDLAMGTPGSDIDDGFALAVALGDPTVTVDLVTTVNGNTDVETATALTLELLRRLEREDVPVHRGAAGPLLRTSSRKGTVPADLAARAPQPGIAAVVLVEHVLAHPGEITLVAVGPLTNVALALRLHPEFAASLGALVIMGGVYGGHTHRADMPGEFNVWSDPEAAQIVLTSGVRARWVGLDVTQQVLMTRAEALELAASERPFASFAGEHTVAWIDHLHEGRQDPGDSCPLHDPLAVVAVLQPELLMWRDAYVQVELGDRARGVMVTDYDRAGSGLTANAQIAVAVNAAAARELILARIGEH